MEIDFIARCNRVYNYNAVKSPKCALFKGLFYVKSYMVRVNVFLGYHKYSKMLQDHK